jgi:hypothetical protein
MTTSSVSIRLEIPHCAFTCGSDSCTGTEESEGLKKRIIFQFMLESDFVTDLDTVLLTHASTGDSGGLRVM